MESKNLDESIGMADFDYAMPEASSLDIANTSLPIVIDGKRPGAYLPPS
jgi:hypothetical protein